MEEGAKDGVVESAERSLALTLHAFSDVSSVSPVIFLFLLKESYVYGKSKSSVKFRVLQQQVNLVLQNTPRPGPAVFILRCLYALPLFEDYADRFSHLIVYALRRFLKGYTNHGDMLEARDLAAKLFLDVVQGFLPYDDKILAQIIEIFDVKLVNFERALCGSAANRLSSDTAETFIEKYILRQIDSQSYMTAVCLLERFGIRHSGESFLLKMIEDKDFGASEKWASYIGKSMLCVLVQEYIKLNMLRDAYGIIKRNNLQEEFPEFYRQCKQSTLKRLAEKGCWDIAEGKAMDDRLFLEYLVYLAMEAGYSEKVDELCDRYSIEGLVKAQEPEVHFHESHYLQLRELFIDEIIWVDVPNTLQTATSYIEGCNVVGLDCEWKPNFEKGSKPNKVSIMQLASEKKAFIFDLIKLYDDVPELLNSCLVRILQSPRILKLGYNFQCDLHQLSRSYQTLDCFKRCELLLDLQKVFKEPGGGLSGLVKKILGAGLNKTRRNSNWEQRPLTEQQLEYAALDAVVLIHLFQHVSSHLHPSIAQNSNNVKMEWKSYITSARTKSIDPLFRAFSGMSSLDQKQTASLHALVIQRSRGRKMLERKRNVKLRPGSQDLVKLLEHPSCSSPISFRMNCV